MPGKPISQAEVTHVSQHGFWLLLADEELFLPFTDFPWFLGATIEQLCQVEWPTENHLFCLLWTLTCPLSPSAIPPRSR